MNWQELASKLLETTQEYLQQHSTDEEFINDDTAMHVAFVMDIKGNIECTVGFADGLPEDFLVPAMGTLLSQINNGHLSNLCLESLTAACQSADNVPLQNAIVTHWNGIVQLQNQAEVVKSSQVFSIDRPDIHNG
jgi:hypothetical protein